jgi:cytochrome c peroxidase
MKITIKLLLCLLVMVSCGSKETNKNTLLREPKSIAELGELLFFDSILSKNDQVSCASCHKPEYAFADNVAFSFGVDSLVGNRNAPSAMNVESRNFLFHDGRAETLEDQAAGPIENPVEMALPITEAIRKIKEHPQYPAFFQKLFHTLPNRENLLKAIAEYERTLETSDTPFDYYMQKKDTNWMSESAKRGRVIFHNKGKCFDCHFGPDFTGDQFRNIGLFNGKDLNDSGRFIVSKSHADIGKFRTPGLRNVSVTAPYMHNGMFKTLREVIDYYDKPDEFVKNSVNRDTLLNGPLNLTETEKKDLEAFLFALTDKRFEKNR